MGCLHHPRALPRPHHHHDPRDQSRRCLTPRRVTMSRRHCPPDCAGARCAVAVFCVTGGNGTARRPAARPPGEPATPSHPPQPPPPRPAGRAATPPSTPAASASSATSASSGARTAIDPATGSTSADCAHTATNQSRSPTCSPDHPPHTPTPPPLPPSDARRDHNPLTQQTRSWNTS